ncbi:MAG: tRNA-dihydrouridine synthase family protein [Lachnospiraceae bacterium]|nr:tRNA-dihydrouridine synthase family protein [Lachnospiraceae bacterium]
MKIYFAPLEGITGFVFRNAYEKYYGGIDKYFTPFITPHTKKSMDMREKRDILLEHNKGIYVVPQILTNQAEDLVNICKELKEYGYNEVNLNLGCPSKTVTAKHKGSGFLENPLELERFFDTFFEKSDTKLSIKTRIGRWELEEAMPLFQVYEKFPFEEIIIHARLGSEFYQGIPHYDVFEEYGTWSKQSLCYNGDIVNRQQLDAWNQKWSFCDTFMIGRGLIANPQMLETVSNIKENTDSKMNIASQLLYENQNELSNNDLKHISYQNCELQEIFDSKRFLEFHNALVHGYAEYLSGDRNILFRMKELWSYWAKQFTEGESFLDTNNSDNKNQMKLIKMIKKTNTLKEYQSLVEQLIC